MDLKDVRRQLTEVQRILERETIERTETENKLRTALEKAQFESSVVEQVGRLALSLALF